MTRVDHSFIIATPRNNNARLTPLAASYAASSNSDRDSASVVLVSVKLLQAAFSFVSRIPPFRAGIFKASGSFDPMKFGSAREEFPRPLIIVSMSPPSYPSAWVAVGMRITAHPPRRSVRAELPHTAPPSDTSVEAYVGIGMKSAGTRNPPVEDRPQTIPVWLPPLTATA
jgi:hypothetical protein